MVLNHVPPTCEASALPLEPSDYYGKTVLVSSCMLLDNNQACSKNYQWTTLLIELSNCFKTIVLS